MTDKEHIMAVTGTSTPSTAASYDTNTKRTIATITKHRPTSKHQTARCVVCSQLWPCDTFCDADYDA